MLTQYDKAIVAFLTPVVAILLPDAWLSPEITTAITPFVTAIATWAVPNKPQ